MPDTLPYALGGAVAYVSVPYKHQMPQTSQNFSSERFFGMDARTCYAAFPALLRPCIRELRSGPFTMRDSHRVRV